MILFDVIIDEPQLTQIIFPPSDLSEIKLKLPHLPQTLFLFFGIYLFKIILSII